MDGISEDRGHTQATPQDPATIPPDAGGHSSPTHQGLSLLDFLSPRLPALPHHLDGRSDWIWGCLQGENGTVINQDMEGHPAAQWEASGSPDYSMLCPADTPGGQMLHCATPGTPALQSTRSSGREGPTVTIQVIGIRAVTAGAGDTKDVQKRKG